MPRSRAAQSRHSEAELQAAGERVGAVVEAAHFGR